jgi:hypothetical protein
MSAPEETPGPILVRTSFTEQIQWDVLRGILLRSGPDRLRLDVTVIDDPCWEDATHFEVRAMAGAHPVVVVADEQALSVTGLRPMILRPRRERMYARPLWQLLAAGQEHVGAQGRGALGPMWVPSTSRARSSGPHPASPHPQRRRAPRSPDPVIRF